jgi:hypothetical protein
VELPAECCFYPDQRFILRSTNPLETAGAGTAVDLVPDRRRRITPAELRYYEGRNLADYVRDSPGGIAEAGPLALRWLRDPREVLDEAAREPHLAIVPARLGKRDSTLLWHDTLPEGTLGTLAEKVAASGSVAAEWPLAELAGELGVPRPLSHALLREVLGSEAAGRFRETLRLGPNTLRYDPEKGGMSETERKIADRLLESLRADALKPDRLAEYARASGADRRLFDKVAGVLIRQGRLVRIDNEFALGAGQWEALLRGLGELPASGVTPAEFGRHFGITRKHTMPYLEGLNRMGMMRREGGRHRVVGEKVARGLTHGHGSGESPRSNS